MDSASAVCSYSTGWVYGDYTNSQDKTCTSNGVVYCISCSICGIQYVGQTKQQLKKRLSGHKSAIRQNKNTLIAKHFGVHGMNSLRIRILEVVQGDEKDLLDAEDFWIKALNTMYPLGLNDRIRGIGKATDCDSCTDYKFSPFLAIRGARRPRQRGKKVKIRTTDYAIRINELEQTNLNTEVAKIFRLIQALKNKEKLKVFRDILGGIIKMSKEVAEIVSAFLSGFFKKDSTKSDPPPIRISVEYGNKGLDKVRLATIFQDRELKRICPDVFATDQVVYRQMSASFGSPHM
ncbi:MAG: GIY-YIG nuclease family protein [Gammaproteobacteria bacterium]|nr:GIY-YIG nuclease family protein [Gammaproteobacteria bacterium]